MKDGGPLRALGLHRPELRAWALYDWANSAFATTVMAAVLPIYYADVAAATLPEHLRSAYWGYTTSAALLLIALASPVLGAAADYLGARKRFLAGFLVAGASATSALYFVGTGDWLLASAIFIVANVGFAGANVFYEALLPYVATPDEVDRLSTAGYAVGYVGGGILLALNMAWIVSPATFGIEDAAQASRLAFVSVAVWWVLFSIPLFRRVPEPDPRLEPGEILELNPARVGFSRVWATVKELRRHRQVFLFLLAFWFYNDGIGTIIKMATIYGREVGIGTSDLIGALLLVQFLGIPFTFAFGALANRIGARRGIYLALSVYTLISVFGFFMQEAWHFWALAGAVATVQGGAQALSRSFFARIVPAGKSSEFFGFYSVSSKFAGILGPFLFALVAQLAGGSRPAILSLSFFFLAGIFLLTRVDEEEGRRVAGAEDETLRVRATAGDPVGSGGE